MKHTSLSLSVLTILKISENLMTNYGTICIIFFRGGSGGGTPYRALKPDKAGQGWTRLDKAGQGWTRPDKAPKSFCHVLRLVYCFSRSDCPPFEHGPQIAQNQSVAQI